jgi:stalled ribosome rescue protein Dom34
VLWLDHFEATVMHVHPDGGESMRISSARPPEERHLHRKSGEPGDGHLADDTEFFAHVAEALDGSEVILVCGPGQAKTSFVSYLRRHRARLADRIVAVEALDHPTDAQLLRHAQLYFKRLQALGAL